MSFIVFSLPRSRSTWLSLFLSYAGRQVGHDVGIDCETPAEFLEAVGDGSCETGAAFAWRLIRRERPDMKFAVVRRSPWEVASSLSRLGVGDQTAEMAERGRSLSEISALPGVLTLDYHDLAKRDGCAALFEHCLGVPFDVAWWRRWEGLNVQVDIEQMKDKLRRNYDAIQNLKRLAIEEMAGA